MLATRALAMPALPTISAHTAPRAEVADLLPHRDQAYRLALRMLGNGPDAEDAVQQAYLQALRFAGKLPAGEAGRRWFLAVVANAARRLRNRRRRRRDRDLHDVEPTVPEPTPAGERSPALLRALAEALTTLDEKFRTALALRFELGLPYEEAALVAAVPPTRLRLHVSRGLAKLRERLARRGFAIDESTLAGALVAGLPLQPSAPCIATVDAIAHGAPPAGLKLVPATAGTGTAVWVALAAVIGATALAALPFARPRPSSSIAAAAPAHPTPAAKPQVDRLLDEVVTVDYRDDSLRSMTADLSLRVGLRHGTRILNPFCLSGAATSVMGPEPSHRVGDLLGVIGASLGGSIDVQDKAIILWKTVDFGALMAVIAATSTDDPNARALAVMRLADLGSLGVCQPLFAELADPAPVVVDAALDGLWRCGPALGYAIDRNWLAKSLAPVLDAHPNGWRAAMIADILAACGGDEAAPLLKRLRTSDDPGIRLRAEFADYAADFAAAPETLAKLDRWGAEEIGAALAATGAREPTADEKRLLTSLTRAAQAAIAAPTCWFRAEPAQQTAAERGLEQPEPDRWMVALAIAARAGCANIGPELAKLLGDRDPLVRARAAMALGQSRAATAKAPLVALLKTETDREVHRNAVWALGELRGIRTTDALGPLLGDPDEGLPALVAMSCAYESEALPVIAAAKLTGVGAQVAKWTTVAIADPANRRTVQRPIAGPESCRFYASSLITGAGSLRAEWLERTPAATSPQRWQFMATIENEARYYTLDADTNRRLLAELGKPPSPLREGLPGRAMPAAAAPHGETFLRWNSGRNSLLSIGAAPGIVQPCTVVTREANGALIVSYRADAYLDAAGALQVVGPGALLSGPRACDWSPENFTVTRTGAAEVLDDNFSGQPARVELTEPPAAPPAKSSSDF